MQITIHHVHKPDEATSTELRRLNRHIRALIERTEAIMVDTSKLLEAVERQKTESAGLRELAKGQHAALVEIKGKLADAVAKLDAQAADQAGLAKVQEDIDKAVADLSVDDADVAEALKANVEPENQNGGAAQPLAGSGQPLPGTGVQPPPEQPADQQPAPTEETQPSGGTQQPS